MKNKFIPAPYTDFVPLDCVLTWLDILAVFYSVKTESVRV